MDDGLGPPARQRSSAGDHPKGLAKSCFGSRQPHVGTEVAPSKGAMSATIAVLLDLDWTPVLPWFWLDPDKKMAATIQDIPSVRREILGCVVSYASRAIWKKAAEHFGGAGLETGPPDFAPARQARRLMVKAGA